MKFDGTEKYDHPRTGRGRSKFCYTMKTISELSVRSIWTVRKAVRDGQLRMDDLVSVAEYVKKYGEGK